MNRILLTTSLLVALAGGCSGKSQTAQQKRESDRAAMKLEEAQRERDQARAQLVTAQQQLDEARTQQRVALEKLEAELNRTGVELKQARAFSDQLKMRLNELNTKLETLQKSSSAIPSHGTGLNK